MMENQVEIEYTYMTRVSSEGTYRNDCQNPYDL